MMLKLFDFLVLVGAGVRPSPTTQPIESETTTELNVAEQIIDIITTVNNSQYAIPSQDKLRILSNIVNIDFENKAPIDIGQSENRSEPLIVVRDDRPTRPIICFSPLLMPLTLIGLILSAFTLIFTIILYSKQPVIQKNSRIYVAQQDRYNESTSLTSSCE